MSAMTAPTSEPGAEQPRPTPYPLLFPVLVGGAVAAGGWALRLLPDPMQLPTWLLVLVVLGPLVVWALHRPGRSGTGRLILGLPLLTAALWVVVAIIPFPQPVPPPGMPAGVADLPVMDGVLPANTGTAVVFRGSQDSVRTTVEFSSVSALSGHWASRNAEVTGDGLAGPVRVAGREQTWGDTISTSRGEGKEDDVTPELAFDLPLGPELEHRTLALSAAMTVTYPSGYYTFTNETTTVARTFRLLVGSPADRAFRVALDRLRQRDLILAHHLPASAGVGLLGLVLTAFGARAWRLRLPAPAPRPVRPPGAHPVRPPEPLGASGLVARRRSRKHVVLDEPVAGSPAERAGLRAGDVLYWVDDRPLTAATVRTITDWPPGTSHSVSVLREGASVRADLVV